MTIVCIATSFPRWPDDHAGRFVLDASRGIAALGHRVIHVVPGAAGAVEHESLAPSLEVRRVRYGPSSLARIAYGSGIGGNLRRAPWRAAMIPSLLKSLRRGVESACSETTDPVLLSHWLMPCGMIASSVARRRGIRHVAVAHGGDVGLCARMPGGRRIVRRVFEGVDRAVCVSRNLRDRLHRLAGPRLELPIDVIPMGVVLDRFPQTPLPRRDGTSLRILAVGRLVRIKGFDVLLTAVARAGGGIDVTIAGDGPQRERLRRLTRMIGHGTVRFLGHLGPAVLARAYRDSHVVVLPSRERPRRSEGSPVVAAEAFATGRPVVASATGGLAEIVQDGVNGLLVPPGDADQLASRLVRLRDDTELLARLGRAAASRAADFDHRRVGARIAELLG